MPTPNEEFIAVWNEILVPKFKRFRHVFVAGAEAHSNVALSMHKPREGERVLDVGCGFGDTSIDLARRVGPRGSALGIDCCDALLDVGREEAKTSGTTNVKFVIGDAQDFPFEPIFDLCFSRFGTMFFGAPKAAMRNMRRALKPGGRLMMITWRTLDDNPWLGIPKHVVLEHLPPPPDDGRKCGPGPFSMADEETVRAILEGAGYTNVQFERIDTNVLVGRSIDEAIQFQLELGPAGEIVREAGDLGASRRVAIVEELHRALDKFAGPEGVVMSSSSWCITATNPS